MADSHLTTLRPLTAAIFAAVVAAAIIGVLEALAAQAAHPMDRAKDLQRLPGTIVFAGVAGFVLGGVASLACQLSRRRVSFVRSLCIVGACLVVARHFTESRQKAVDPTQAIREYGAFILAISLGVGIVILYGKYRARLTQKA